MAEKATATLIAGDLVTREQLAALPTPVATGPYHKPVPHIDMVTLLEQRLQEKLGARISSEKFGLLRSGATLFGVVTLEYGSDKQFSAAIGFRHANDRTMAMNFVAGASVFVCENMVLRGDNVMFKKRHTTNVNLVELMDDGIVSFSRSYKKLEEDINNLRHAELTTDEAKCFIFDAFYNRTKNEKGREFNDPIMPCRLLPNVAQEYFHPRHAEFEPRTEWSLHNAFTEVAKTELPITSRLRATQRLGGIFNMDGFGDEAPIVGSNEE